jgi:chromatin remodeling complex protein RSC6
MPATKSTSNVNTMPAEKKTVTKTAAPKTTKKAAAAEVTVPTTTTPAAAPVVPATAPVTTETTPAVTRTSADVLAALQETLKALQTEVTARVRSAVHDAQEAVKAVKREAREGKRRRRVDPADMTPEQKAAWEARRANNAFLKPRPLSDELATFMGLPAKSQKSQTEVTEFVSRYVKSHNCFDPNFKRRIIPDAKLAKLLRAKDGEEVTYLNLQKFLKVHFIKPATA